MKNIPSIVAFVAALGLLALTAAVIVRPAADLDLWRGGTMALAWVVVLATGLAARERVAMSTAIASEEPPRHDDMPRRPDTASIALFDFAREVHGTLESDKLRLLISRRLPLLLGVRDVWIVARLGTRQQIILPAASGVDPMILVSDEPRHWATFPMKSDGRTIGLMGAALPDGGFTEAQQKLFKNVASLLAQALSTATAFETMREASLVDPLTGCATRAEGSRRLEAELRRAQRSRTSLAVLMLDLDHFKSINDRFGHKTGDAALTAVGETLLTTLRASDVRCRWGGEEFLLVLPDANVERAQRAADKLRQRIASTPIGVGDQVVSVTASIGLTLSVGDETDAQSLITRADAAMYEAKRNGRNRTSIVLAGPAAGRRSAVQRAEDSPVHTEPVVRAEPGDEPAADEWDGVERRDPHRRDRRRTPSPGRRATDAVVSGRWRDS